MSSNVQNSDPVIEIDEIDSKLLREAVERKELDEVKRLLSLGADVNTRDEKNLTILHLAAQKNQDDSHFDVIKILLENGANVNAQNRCGVTPLHSLVKNADVKTVKLLLDHKADINIGNEIKLTPIFYAIINSRHAFEVFKLLVDSGSSIFSTTNNLATPLHWACSCETPDTVKVVKFMLINGVNIEALDRNQSTPLFYCLCFSKSLDLLGFMFKYANFKSINFVENPNEYFLRHEFIWKKLLEHIAKLHALDIAVHPSFFQDTFTKTEFNAYFQMCTKELVVAKKSKLQNCWIYYFNLLVDSKTKLKNYAGNIDFIEDFKNNDCLEKFPIYGAEMQKNVEKGLKMREAFDKSSIALSNCLPKFNPSHLIIRDILDCNVSYKNYSVFLTEE